MRNSFGLDIGTSSIKAVMLGGDRGHPSFRASIAAPTPAKGMMSESPFDQEEMAHTIRKTLNDAGITGNVAHIALADNQVFTKVIEMPILSDKEIANAIHYEAEQYIPAPLNTITYDWRVLQKNGKGVGEGKMQVLLVGAPQSIIKRYQSILELVGIQVASIETEMLAALRSIVVGTNFPTTLVINIGALTTSLAIVQNGVMIFTYSIPLGGIAINRAIAADFGFTIQQAEEYKKTYGIADKNFGGKIGKAIEPILLTMLSEVKKALTFYTEKYKNELPVTQILLSGGTAQLPGIDLFFVQNVNIETAIANPWRILNISNVPKEIMDSGSKYSIAVGLALKAYE